MSETLGAQAAHPGAVVEGLCNDFARRAAALELYDVERTVLIERQEVDPRAMICDHLAPQQH
jgi:hypothetical protein